MGNVVIMNKIIIADANKDNRNILKNILKEEYEIMEEGKGTSAWETIRKERKSLKAVLLNPELPEMDGFQILENMNQSMILDSLPVIIISDERQPEFEGKCMEVGAADYISRPFHDTVVKKRVENLINNYTRRKQLEEKVENQMLTLRKQYVVLQVQADKLQKKNDDMIEVVSNVAEYRSLESGNHLRRVKKYTRILGEYVKDNYPEYGLTDELLDIIVSASALHDIGKVAIPDSILLNPGRLSDDEFDYLRSHTIRGSELLDDFTGVWSEEYVKIGKEICRSHHERYDGKGYPDGLVGDKIPISAQLVSIVDVYDAMTNERFYKGALAIERVFYMITNGECGVFSPKLLEAFRKVKPKFEEMAVAYRQKLQGKS